MKKLVIIALIMAIATGFAVYYYASTFEERFSVETVPVAVAAKTIPKNTVIAPEMILIKELPLAAVNQLAIRSMDDIKGFIAKETIEVNEQVLKTKVSDPEKKDNGLAYAVKDGFRALTVGADEISGVAGFISKGDFVDIVAILMNKTNQIVSSHMIAENVEVLEVGLKGQSTEGKNAQYASVTVAAPAEDVLKISYALSEGKVRLVLRPVLDKNIVNPEPFTQ